MITRRAAVLGLGAGLATGACAPPPAPERAAYLTATGAPPQGPAPRAGLLLPLSGAGAEQGTFLLDAARQALAEVEPGALVLVPQDTVPEAGAAARRAVELGCDLLIGPLGGSEASAVADAARRPTLALSNDTGIARAGLWPFGIDPESQAARAAALAVGLGRTRLGILVPEDAYGLRLLRGLEDALAARPGAQVTARVAYPPGTNLLSLSLPADLRASEAVLVGDGGAAPNAAATLLTGGPRLLGTLQWLREPDPAGTPPPPGAWIAVPDPTAGASFAARYQKLFGRPAPALAPLVADAVGVAALVARSGGFALPLLTRPEGFKGRLGTFRLTADGRVERLLAVAETGRDGRLTVVDPAPTTFGGVAG